MDMRGKDQWGEKNPQWKGHLDKNKLTKWYQKGLSLSDISKQTEVSTTTIFRRFKKYNIPTDPKRRKRREESNLWKGGRILRNGYILIKVDNHPYSNYGGYVQEHRLVMEKHLGRYLEPSEIPHHRDGNRRNNQLSNLKLSLDSPHKTYHAGKRRRDKLGRFK